MNISELRSAIADALTEINDALTVDAYVPTVAQLPHAWVSVDSITPEVFGHRGGRVVGSVTFCVSGADEEGAWELLDEMLSDDSIVDAFNAVDFDVSVTQIVAIGEDVEIAGQVFKSFVVEWEAHL